MSSVYICDAIRTPIGRYGGALSSIRADDLGALPLAELMRRQPDLPWCDIDDVILGCANQAGEDNRNVARMSSLLAGLPFDVPGVTVNRLCGSGMNAVGDGARAIRSGEARLIVAGGVESMSRAPWVMGKASTAFGRDQQLYDTTMGWRFINPKLDADYGTEVMPQTAENLARKYQISREDQDRFALGSQIKAAAAQEAGWLAEEIMPVHVREKKSERLVLQDEHPRQTSLETLAGLRPLFSEGTVTAGNASGINDGAAAILLGSEQAVDDYGLQPLGRILGMAVAGVEPTVMGFGPVPATKKLLQQLGMTLDDFHLLELNEAFAAQVLACTRAMGLADDDSRLNPQGGAIAFGHPLGMSGARLIISALRQLQRRGGGRALCSMCVGVGQGIAVALEV